MDLLNNISSVVLLNVNISDILNILCELLVSLVISVIKRAAVETHNASEAVHVIDGSGGGDLSTETVTTD